MAEPKVIGEFRDYVENAVIPPERRAMMMAAIAERDALAERVKELEALYVADTKRNMTEIAKLREALREYGHHKPHCSADPCTCGILEALQETMEERGLDLPQEVE
jgi:hypothetical protein